MPSIGLLPGARIACSFLTSVACCGCAADATVLLFHGEHGDFTTRATTNPPVIPAGSGVADSTIDNEAGEFTPGQALSDASVPLPRSADSFLVPGELAGVLHHDFGNVRVLADQDQHRPAVATHAVGTGALPLGGFPWHIRERRSFQVLLPCDVDLVSERDDWIVWPCLLLEADEFRERSPAVLELQGDLRIQGLLEQGKVEQRLVHGNGTDDLNGALEPAWFLAARLTWRF